MSWASSEHARRTMKANRRRDTKPELLIRTALHQKGLRFRVDFPPVKSIRRRADIVLTRARIVIFVDGCFWHRCPEHFTLPKTNSKFWKLKIQQNWDRDRDTDWNFERADWLVLRFWEHEDSEKVVATIIEAWRSRLKELG
ncbi:very short patch repair endonuclease [Brevibacterium limosum]|uniref:very short patch repair endonuclease n=1 Tax=Brevibacterium limosum TaxID=2697565 RepID=UPI00141DE6F1|nr:DNA mismatch endonuclease Vsr [Brevibacterium limosum]